MNMNSVMQVQNTIRQQSEDLRNELADLAKWENDIKSKKQDRLADSDLPPVRGTAAAQPKVSQKNKARDAIADAKDAGNEFFRKSNFSGAVEAYSKGIDLYPNNAETHLLYANRAMCQLKLKNYNEAERDATVCIQMNRTYPKAFFRRAMARKALGRWKDARADLETVLVLNPGDDESQDELQFVTERIREEQAKETTETKKPKKKLLVIEEVDDEDEDAGSDGELPAASPAEANPQQEEERRKRIERDMRQVQEEEAARAQTAAKEAERHAEVAMKKANPRVAIIEEEEEPAPAPPAKEVPVSKPVREPTPSSAKREESTGTSSPEQRKRNINLKRWNVDTLTAPKSLTEFEKIISEIADDQALLHHYVMLVEPSSYKSLLGSSASSEVVMQIISAASSESSEKAFEMMTGLSKVSRLEEIAMFLDSDEVAKVKKILADLKSSGKSVDSIRSAFDL